jgi:transposase-like protein
MPINRVQFQPGMSMSEFVERYGSEEKCAAALERTRWPAGFRCPKCGGSQCYRIAATATHRSLMQCTACRHQTSLTAGTVLDSSKLPLRTWFLAFYLVSQAKTGLSSLALMRQLGVTYRTAWLLQQKVRSVMAQADESHRLCGDVQVDDAYLGGERPGVGGRGSPNKVPFVAAVSLTPDGRPLYAKMSPVAGFSNAAVKTWALASLVPGTNVLSDGLACFSAVIDAQCAHSYIVVGKRKPRELPEFRWVNTVLANLKTMIKGAHKSFKFGKYAGLYLGAFNYRFNHRFDLAQLVTDVIVDAVRFGPRPERVIRRCAEVHA